MLIMMIIRFKYKYHPEEYNRNQEETRKLMEMRCKVFARLLELNRVEAVPLDTGSSENLIRLLDAGMSTAGFKVSYDTMPPNLYL